ncbi:MAG TPA: D-sedoheptulose 7-phosphate isomerase [Deferrisomatales bacterium]|nr:D-sedoheptulose 7-phosphate isomerase [Deferrisomatales bacterium]
MTTDLTQHLTAGFDDGADALRAFGRECGAALVELAQGTATAIRDGGKVLVFGNGGSAADAQHLAAEFVNRFRIDRPPLPAIALTTDSSALTAIGNDFGFDQVFDKPVRALARPGDVVIGITTSGTSPNVVRALTSARDIGCLCAGLTGAESGPLEALCRFVFRVPSRVTPRIQECHIAWVHAYCDAVDRLLFPEAHG